MDIKTFASLATKLPPQIAVLLRGPTGVGKSHLVGVFCMFYVSLKLGGGRI